MVKRALTLLTSILIALPLLMPFNIYGDTAIVVGTDVSLIDSTLIRTESYTDSGGTVNKNNILYTYKVTAQLDNNYVGYLLLKLNYSYYNNPQSGLRTDSDSVTRRIFINGDKAEFNFTINTWYSSDPLLRNTTNATPNVVIQEQGVTLLSELDSIQQIIDILNDLYNSQDQIEGLLSNQLEQLELIVSNTSLANEYLDTISKLRTWNVPIESFSAIIYPLQHYDTYQYNQVNNYVYPSFFINNNDIVFQRLNYTYETYKWIFITSENMHNINSDSPSSLYRYFKMYDMNGNELEFEFTSYTAIDRSLVISDRLVGKFVSVEFKVKGAHLNFYNCKFIYPTNMIYIPIYLNVNTNKNISTDFALQFGLSNILLDDVHLIANGTAQSSSAASSNDLANEQLQTDSNTLFTQEDNFKSDMNNAMQNVNNTFRLSNMGTKFVSSAQWVRTQYENLTNNTPFASLITFSLITGLALILLGKVYK